MVDPVVRVGQSRVFRMTEFDRDRIVRRDAQAHVSFDR